MNAVIQTCLSLYIYIYSQRVFIQYFITFCGITKLLSNVVIDIDRVKLNMIMNSQVLYYLSGTTDTKFEKLFLISA